jgi:16S rRNA (guanine966-N2)-methyltransferase
MRITSGILRNRRFKVPDQEVRPTQERVREAVFSSLGGSCAGLRVLDLFAGAGGLGLEAWSRGAESVVFVEQNAKVWKNLQQNIQMLEGDGLGTVRCVRGDAIGFLGRAAGEFDLILADPPYDLPGAMEQTLAGIAEHSVLTADGLLVYELRSSDTFEVSNNWTLFRDKVYGDARVLMLKLNEGDLP